MVANRWLAGTQVALAVIEQAASVLEDGHSNKDA
ncbi:hypothetical protein FHT02_001641 [Sphingomonas xinjiangensis]|uniref:Uncharacterized protein n=1 Tax=Sphingomonas xinjiangensis TaxID=643568 RepID=A0A840YLY6_9SPHN|nr:hypothetical protein [Sphingomonas xinjiangensis]